MWKWIIGIPVAAIGALFLIGALSGPASEKDIAREAIKLCWSDQSKKSLDPGTARFVASTCEKMETEYKARWNANP